MPTDQVLTLIAEMRAKADAMPSGPYRDKRIDVYVPKSPDIMLIVDPRGRPLARIGIEEFHQTYHFGFNQLAAAQHFAALDPALVRALLDVVEAADKVAKANLRWDEAEGDDIARAEIPFQFAMREVESGLRDLAALAADRAAS